jgi:hypothetical protein
LAQFATGDPPAHDESNFVQLVGGSPHAIFISAEVQVQTSIRVQDGHWKAVELSHFPQGNHLWRGKFPSYGWPRITAELKRRGWKANHKRVYRILREDNLLCPPLVA